MNFPFAAPIGPDDSAMYSDFSAYLKPDTHLFSAAHALLETEFVGPIDPLLNLLDPVIPNAWNDVVDLIPDPYLAIKSPFAGSLTRDANNPAFVHIQLDKIKYAKELAASPLPVLNKLTHAYLGPIDFAPAMLDRLNASIAPVIRVAANEPIGTLQDRVFRLGFYRLWQIRVGDNWQSRVIWIDPGTVIYQYLSAQHPLIASRPAAERIRVVGPTASENGSRPAPPTTSDNYFCLELEKDGVHFEFHQPTKPIPRDMVSAFSEDQFTTRIRNPAGDYVAASAGAATRFSMTRKQQLFYAFRQDGDLETTVIGDSSRNPEYLDSYPSFGQPLTLRGEFPTGVYTTVNDEELLSYVVHIAYKFAPGDSWSIFELFQDDTDRLREEYRERALPVPPREHITTPQLLRSPYFDARELHLQHDYNHARSRFYGGEDNEISDLTLLEDNVRQVADFVQTRYVYHLLLSPNPLITTPGRRQRTTTRLRITRSFVNPRKNAAFGYGRRNPRQYGHFIEFEPVYRTRTKMKALRMACSEFLHAVRDANATSTFEHLFLQFTRMMGGGSLRGFWKIGVDENGNETASASVRINDDGTVQSRPLRRINGNEINSTVLAERYTRRIALTWQPVDLLTRPNMPVAPINPDIVSTAANKKTSVILLATEGDAVPAEYQLAFDDKAKTLAAWLKRTFPQDNDPITVETVTLGDAFGALGLFNNDDDEEAESEDLRIRYLAVISHSRYDALYLRWFEVSEHYDGPALNLNPADDTTYTTRYRSQRSELKSLYPRRVPIRMNGEADEISASALDYRCLSELSEAARARLREVFSTAEAIFLTGCASGYTRETQTHQLGPIAAALARVTNTDVYASKEKVYSYGLKSDGNWKFHGSLLNSTTDAWIQGPFRNDDATYPDLYTPLTVVSVRNSVADAYDKTDGVHKVDPTQFDVLAHYTSHLNLFQAPLKRRVPTAQDTDEDDDDVDQSTIDFDDD